MTWKSRQSMGLCCYQLSSEGCLRERVAHTDYCEHHLKGIGGKRPRNAKYMAWARLYKRVQLGLFG
jgi:hypothetical protein